MKKNSIFLIVLFTNLSMYSAELLQSKDMHIQKQKSTLQHLTNTLKQAKKNNAQLQNLLSQFQQIENKIKPIIKDIQQKSDLKDVEQAIKETLDSLSKKTGPITIQILKLRQQNPEKNKNQIMKLQNEIEVLKKQAKSKDGQPLEDLEKRLEIIKKRNREEIHQKTKKLEEKRFTLFKKIRERENKDPRIIELQKKRMKELENLTRLHLP